MRCLVVFVHVREIKFIRAVDSFADLIDIRMAGFTVLAVIAGVVGAGFHADGERVLSRWLADIHDSMRNLLKGRVVVRIDAETLDSHIEGDGRSFTMSIEGFEDAEYPLVRLKHIDREQSTDYIFYLFHGV